MEALQIYSLNARETYGVIIKRIEVLTQKMEDDRAITIGLLVCLHYWVWYIESLCQNGEDAN